ncbi:hypothetical protein OG321_35900 [Streptomyces sp. NBC_00424]|uniref:hypothetical protein n=1 Tax=unclassified Streptomyces TaxID=2593676 RepID=UPI00131D0711|nr:MULTISPECIES: hypothetical protein [unclassified Streptomyces]MCX5077840.1 hypothetical protein [Streptomyces sp. NBC_00424]
MTSDVFSRAVRRRNARGMTFSQMEAKTWSVGGKEGSRSSAWWNNMANYEMETPPAPKYIPGVAEVLKVSERRVSELVSEQWYGVRPDDEVPERLRDLIPLLEDVDPVDLAVVEELVIALGKKRALAERLARIEAGGEAEEGGSKAA